MGWEERYNEAIRTFLADHMTVISDEYTRFSREDWSAQKHMTKCMFDPANLKGATVTEKTIYEFAGTFVDDERAVVLRIQPVTCMCGEVAGRTGEWAGSFEELVVTITDNRVNTREIVL